MNWPRAAPSAKRCYADDDAVATHRLLEEAGVQSLLLVRPDATSEKLYPGLRPHGPPNWRSLSTAVALLGTRIRGVVKDGRSVELLFFYSGHGDVAGGEAWVGGGVRSGETSDPPVR